MTVEMSIKFAVYKLVYTILYKNLFIQFYIPGARIGHDRSNISSGNFLAGTKGYNAAYS
jgi:hypothetical protein